MNPAFLYYLPGPLLFWYIRSIITDNSRLSKRDFWHLIPLLIYLLAELPYLFSSYAFKSDIAKAIVVDSAFLRELKTTVLSEWFGNSLLYLSRPVLVLIYTLWSVIIYIRYLTQKKHPPRFSKQSFMIKWLFILLFFQSLLIISHLVLIFRTFVLDSLNLFYTINTLQILSSIGLIGLLISPFFFPAILYGLPRLPKHSLKKYSAMGVSEDSGSDEKKNIPINLETEYLLMIWRKAEDFMMEHSPFLLPDLNLIKFSELIQIPAHHLAYFFREVRKQSFNDYRNACRVNHAKQLMMEGKAGGLTLEAIGLLSGFSSRITFFRAFKKTESITPSAFLEKINEKPA
jgi:AraC-like DNA-binding protein